MTKKVLVSLSIEELVKYHRYVEMDEAEFERIFEELAEGDNSAVKKAEESLRCMIDPIRDFRDANYLEVTEFMLATTKRGSK